MAASHVLGHTLGPRWPGRKSSGRTGEGATSSQSDRRAAWGIGRAQACPAPMPGTAAEKWR